ncbi:MAG: hypothetical protein Q8P41_11985, partial [Pseudomonadota bacterium]|nr:hypothetical protein [Pseudomonadota bacterium]
ACAAPATETVCDDTLDDDADGAIDCADRDCAADAACAAPATETVCDDTLDDDADGAIDCADMDCAADAACAAPATETVCDDTLDDDADGAIDCADMDCAADAACAATVTETVCDDTLDDDADGLIDCDDSDCAADAACAVSATCADGDLGSALGYGLATGDTTGAGNDYASSCSSSSYTPEDVSWSWTAPADGTYTVTTDDSAFDTVLSIWSSDCSSEATCDDDDGDSTQSMETFTAVAGEQVVFAVDGYNASGAYVLSVYSDAELDCTDGLDEDNDGFGDCDDSDCESGDTCIELVCDDGGDSDADGLVDCDDDDCAEDLYCTNPCADDDLGSIVGAAVATGSTTGAGDDYTSDCAYYSAEDVAWVWTAPADGVYTFDTVGTSFDTILAVETGECSATELDCNDDTSGLLSEVSVALLAGEEVVVHVDGYDSTTSGDYTLNVWSDSEVDCEDAGDDDRDGLFDCDDSDCAAATICLPESVCDDAADNDADAATDCLDADCAADAVCDTALADYDLGSTTGYDIATGDTTGMGNNLTPSCGSSYAEDVAYSWVAPYAGSWTFDLSASTGISDSIIGLYAADGSSLGCDDDSGTGYLSLETVTLDAGQLVIIGIDGYSSETGTYSLAIY